jgi:nucleotide-binding universal stress UspA family protein
MRLNNFSENNFMEKILLAIDAHNMDTNAVAFACYLSRITHSKLTGVFLDNLVVKEDVVIKESHGVILMESISISEVQEDEESIKNISLFEELSAQEGIEADVYFDKEVPATEIVTQSRFADVLIVDATTSFSRLHEGPPTRFVKDILHDAECPVIISPENFNGIDNIVFYYNGSKSSVFAMKQFTYLFPELKNNRAKVIYLNENDGLLEEDEQAISDYLGYHYGDIEFVPLEGDATDAFFNFLSKKKNDLLVMGVYGRGLLDSFFDNETGTSNFPIFVAHY